MNASQQPSSHHGILAPKALLFITLVLYLSGCAHVPPPSRLVAIGDIHGTFEGFAVILQKAQLIDASHQWIGGNATLVQTGDFMDRGPKVKRVMDLLMALEKQASAQGGQVISLIGNHESFNLMDYFDADSTPLSIATQIYADFVDGQSEQRRLHAYQQYETWKSTTRNAPGKPEPCGWKITPRVSSNTRRPYAQKANTAAGCDPGRRWFTSVRRFSSMGG